MVSFYVCLCIRHYDYLKNVAHFDHSVEYFNNPKAETSLSTCTVGDEWVKIEIPVYGNDAMQVVNTDNIVIPAEYNGKKVQVAFMYFAESGNTSGVLSIENMYIRTAIPTGIDGISADNIMNGKVYNL